MNTLLVTGGAGFIGANFIHHVLAVTGMRVVNLDALTYAGNPESLAGLDPTVISWSRVISPMQAALRAHCSIRIAPMRSCILPPRATLTAP